MTIENIGYLLMYLCIWKSMNHFHIFTCIIAIITINIIVIIIIIIISVVAAIITLALLFLLLSLLLLLLLLLINSKWARRCTSEIVIFIEPAAKIVHCWTVLLFKLPPVPKHLRADFGPLRHSGRHFAAVFPVSIGGKFYTAERSRP